MKNRKLCPGCGLTAGGTLCGPEWLLPPTRCGQLKGVLPPCWACSGLQPSPPGGTGGGVVPPQDPEGRGAPWPAGLGKGSKERPTWEKEGVRSSGLSVAWQHPQPPTEASVLSRSPCRWATTRWQGPRTAQGPLGRSHQHDGAAQHRTKHGGGHRRRLGGWPGTHPALLHLPGGTSPGLVGRATGPWHRERVKHRQGGTEDGVWSRGCIRAPGSCPCSGTRDGFCRVKQVDEPGVCVHPRRLQAAAAGV